MRNLFLDPATHIIPKALDGAEGAVAPQHRLNSIPAPVFFYFLLLLVVLIAVTRRRRKTGKLNIISPGFASTDGPVLKLPGLLRLAH